MSKRLIELRNQKKLSQEGLSRELEKAGFPHFDRTTISRVERGDTRRVSSDLLLALASFYDVSVDFLCGLTDNPEKKDYELRELGLTYEAAKKLLLREVEPDAINRLMECENFPHLCDMIVEYCSSDRAEIYEEISRTVSTIRGMADCSADFGFDLSNKEKREMRVWVNRIPGPIEAHTNEMIDQFELVAQDLTSYVRGEKEDPEAMDLTNGQISRLLKREVQVQKHTSNIRMLTEKEVIGYITNVAAGLMGLYPDEKELLEKLYWKMYQNRYEKDNVRKAQ